MYPPPCKELWTLFRDTLCSLRASVDEASNLWRAIGDLQEYAKRAATTLAAAKKGGLTLPVLHERLARVARLIHRLGDVRARQKENLDAVVRKLGYRVTHTAVALLPRPLRAPVHLALRAFERLVESELDRGC